MVATALLLAAQAVPFDHHIHLRSPETYQLLSKLGLEQPRPEKEYTDITELLRASPAQKCFVVSVAYMLAGFGLGAKELEAVKAENDHTARECAKLPGRAFGFASVNPLRDYAPGEIERCLSLPGIAGVKLHFDNSRVSLRDEQHAKAVRAVLLVAAKRNAPALVHMDNRQPEFGAEDARAFLDQVLAELPPMEVYIAHLGTGGGYDESTRAVLGVFEKALPGLKHKVFLDVSGIALPAAFRGIEPLTLEQGKELAATMRRMGLGRFVFGTDFSVTDSATYRSSLRAALPLTDAEFDRVMHNTGPLMSGAN